MADEQRYTFLGGPRHWDNENFRRMADGMTINILEDYDLSVHVWPIPEDFGQGSVSYHVYKVRTFRGFLRRRTFLVHEDLHRLDAVDMVEEYTQHQDRRQEDGQGTRGRGHSQDR